jgi:hypothetical protein
MLLELLRTLQLVHPLTVPPDSKEPSPQQMLDQGANWKIVKLDDLQKLFARQCEDAIAGTNASGELMPSYERRAQIALLLTAVAHLKRPDGEPFQKGAPERVEKVVGLLEYPRALDTLATLLNARNQAISGRLQASQSLSAAQHQELVNQRLFLAARVSDRQAFLNDLRQQLTAARAMTAQRRQEHKEAIARLLQVRKDTAALVLDLRQLEGQLFQAQTEMADASRHNQELYQEIEGLEKALKKVTGP